MRDPIAVENEKKREQKKGLDDLKKQARDSLVSWFEEPGDAPSDLPNFKKLQSVGPQQLDVLEQEFNQTVRLRVQDEMAELLSDACRKGK